MRRIMVFTTLILTLILTGCETDDLKYENKNLITKLDEANKQILDLTKDKKNFTSKMDDLNKNKQQLEETMIEQKQFEADLIENKRLITNVTNINDFQYEIISPAINREPYDKVIYIKNVSEINKDQTLYLLKAALTFSSDNAKIITFWRDRNQAILYRDGQYDPEEGYTGWSGFDYRFGSINNKGLHPKLRQYNSRDDSQFMDFGKYTSTED